MPATSPDRPSSAHSGAVGDVSAAELSVLFAGVCRGNRGVGIWEENAGAKAWVDLRRSST